MKINLGPVTRLEGHLSVITTVEDNRIVDARCQGEMFRGFEAILKDRDPLDAQQITQRICGVCPYAHAIASCYAQEQAYGLTPPPNGRSLQNLIQGANHLYDYLLHFYQLATLDFVDVTAVLEYRGADAELLKVKSWLRAELDSGRPSAAAPFLPRLPGSYIREADTSITLLKHYLEALGVQQKANRASALFGGRFPHATAIFPGGCPRPVTVDLIVQYQALIQETRDFIRDKYLPDLLAVARAFPEYWKIGASRAAHLSFGLLPRGPAQDAGRLFSPGFLADGKVTPVDYTRITEEVRYAKYSSSSGLAVKDGQLQPAPGKPEAYSWIKAPRYNGQVVEVGPAARVLVEFYVRGNPAIVGLVESLTGKLDVEPASLDSVLGRHLCRAISATVIADFLMAESERLVPGQPTIADLHIPSEAEGYGATEASRGALLHYIRLKNYRIDKYECVVPTTWNASPRDDQGRPGALEAALIGTKVADQTAQLEAGRIVRSFDPCLACAIH